MRNFVFNVVIQFKDEVNGRAGFNLRMKLM